MHKCNEQCEQALKGLHFICVKCSTKILVNCAGKAHKEVVSLLHAFELVIVDEDNELVSNVTTKTRKEFDEVFSRNSPVGFTCDQCRIEKATTEQNQNAIISEQQQKIDELQTELAEKVRLIQQLTDENENPNNVNEGGVNAVNVIEEDSEAIVNARELTTKLMWKINTMMTTKFEKISDEITENVTKKVRLQCKKLLNDAEQNKTGTKKPQNPSKKINNDTNGLFTEVADNNGTEHIEDGQTKFNLKLAPPVNNTKEQLQQQQSNQQIKFNDKLVPQFRVENKQMVYAMHVSKFPKAIITDDIIEHIMNNTELISHEAFKVEKLGKPESDYNSFKIWTLSCEAYEMIKKIWAPHYVVRDFDLSKNRSTDLSKNRSTDKASVTFDLNRSDRIRNGYHTPYSHRNNRFRNNDSNDQRRRGGNNRYNTPKRGDGTPNGRDTENKRGRGQSDDHGKETTEPPKTPQQYVYIPYPQQVMPQPSFLGHQAMQPPMTAHVNAQKIQQMPIAFHYPHQM